MLQIGEPKDSVRVNVNLVQVRQQQGFIDFNSAVAKVYASLDKQEKQLSKAFKYVKQYYPTCDISRFVSYVSGFAFQTPIGDDYVGIGLDMFLGADSEF